MDLDEAVTRKVAELTAAKLIAQESRAGGADERYFVRPHGGPPSDHLVSSATVTRSGAHDRVRLWSRGGLAGELVVSAGDGERIAEAHGLEERALIHPEPSELPADGSRVGALYYRRLSDGHDITVYPMFGCWKVCLSEHGSCCIERYYEYATLARAIAAACKWNGHSEPLAGWSRSSERR